MGIVSDRKKEIDRLLKEIDRYPATSNFKQEMMSFAYILVCGAIEFMTETILQEWLYKTVKHHKSSTQYRGKKYVQYFLNSQSRAGEANIEQFHSMKLDQIRGLIKNVAGESAKDKFNQLFNIDNQNSILQPDINSRLDRVVRIRHELAHGQKMPNGIQPNIIELKEDFGFIYKHIIKNIQKCLPRV